MININTKGTVVIKVLFFKLFLSFCINSAYSQIVNSKLRDAVNYELIQNRINIQDICSKKSSANKKDKRRLKEIKNNIGNSECYKLILDGFNAATEKYRMGDTINSKGDFKLIILLKPINKYKGLVIDSYLELEKMELLKNDFDSSFYFLNNATELGYEELDEILNFQSSLSQCKRVEDSTLVLFAKSNCNFLKTHLRNSNLEVQSLCRQMYFDDQFYRIKFRGGDWRTVDVFDSINQIKSEIVLSKYIKLKKNIQYDPVVNKTLFLVFLHSINSNLSFFQENFYKLTQVYNNDFKNFSTLKNLFDVYINKKYGLRYFTNEKMPDENSNLRVPELMSDMKANEVLKSLNIEKATY